MNTVDEDAVNLRSLAILESELKRIREGALDVFRLYLTWFQWCFTTSIVVLGLVVTNKLPPVAFGTIAGAMIVIHGLGIIASLRVRSFFARECTRANIVCASMTEHARQLDLHVPMTSGLSRDITTTSMTAFTVALAVILAAWAIRIIVAMWH